MDAKMKKIRLLKQSQITIFIIIAIIILSGIILFFLLSGNKISILKPSISNPQSYIQKCAEDSAKDAINIILPQGGYITPINYRLYKDNRVSYLCYNKNYYEPCINQAPLYIQDLESEIESYIKPKIKDCFYNLEQEYKDKNYQVNSEDLDLSVELKPKQVKIIINKKLDLKKGDDKRSYKEFKSVFSSPLYELSSISQEIVNQEAEFCYFENLGFSLLYPKFSVERTDIEGETKIYVVEEKISGKKLIFAVRSCALPAGL